jgi:chemotaxis family two-component system response regulator Rcp1
MKQPARRYKILIVEDNPGDAVLIREAFKDCGHDCDLTFTDSLEDATRLLGNEHFHILVSDMGTRNGETTDFIASIRSNDRLRTMPVIALTGSPDPIPAYKAGVNAVIIKPLNVDELFEKIRSLMHFWVYTAELPLRET